MVSRGPRIADNPSFADPKRQARDLRYLLKFGPLLRVFGIRIDPGLADKLGDLEKQIGELAALPDRFNDLMADRGWIAYEMLNVEVIRRTIALGDAGDLDAAENELVDHLDRKTIQWGITFMRVFEAFRPRERLARLALEDYLAERYHACIPVLLMIIDGFVNDVSRTKGFFAEGTDLTAWDSIAAHDRGLAMLAKLWGQTRKKTTTEPISVPYRHGILHGRDLGYDNRLVAAKLWMGLFALREWAAAVRDGRLTEPEPQPEPTFGETFEKIRRTEQQKAALAAWAPRTPEQLATIPQTGVPEDYEEGSPEQKVAELMQLWSKKNYGFLARVVNLPAEGPPKDREIHRIAPEIRNLLGDKLLEAFEILEITDEASARTIVRVAVRYKQGDESIGRVIELPLLHLDDEGFPVVRGGDRGQWEVLRLWGELS